MDEEQLRRLFEQVREGAVDVDSALPVEASMELSKVLNDRLFSGWIRSS